MIVLLDSSILLEAVKNRAKLDELKYIVDERVVFAVPSPVFFELKYMAKNKGKKGAKAKTALKIIKALNAFILGCVQRKSDDALIALSSRNIGVATLDLRVKKFAKEKGARVFTLKQGQYVQEW